MGATKPELVMPGESTASSVDFMTLHGLNDLTPDSTSKIRDFFSVSKIFSRFAKRNLIRDSALDTGLRYHRIKEVPLSPSCSHSGQKSGGHPMFWNPEWDRRTGMFASWVARCHASLDVLSSEMTKPARLRIDRIRTNFAMALPNRVSCLTGCHLPTLL